VELRDVLRVLKSRGVTTLISSHILTELQDVCDQVVIIEKGGLVHAGALDRALAAAREKPVVRIDLGGEAGRAVPVVEKVEGVAGVQASGDSLLVEFSGGEEVIARISSALISAGLRVERVAEDRASLEELFMRLTRGELH
jgi:ABC-2 type transport system ATP-binding protein